MSLALLPLHYLYWHYVLAWRNGFRIYRDLLWFVGHFFSIPTLIRTWFSPWRRLGETYEGGLDPAAWFSALLVNLLMRLVGALARTILILIGLLTWLVTALAGVVMAAVWLVLPFIPLILITLALDLLI